METRLATQSSPRVSRNIPFGSQSIQRLDLYLPGGTPPPAGWPVLLAIHGGGWHRMDKAGYGTRLATLTRLGFAVVAPNYTLARSATPSWPQALSDLQLALRWVAEDGPSRQLDSQRIAALGESAGGHLALLLAYRTSEPDDTPAPPPPRLLAVVGFFAPTDLTSLHRENPRVRAVLRDFLGGSPVASPDRYVDASPLAHLSPDDPPTLLIHGLRDTLIPPSQARSLASRLAAAGISHRLHLLPGLAHGFGLSARGVTPALLHFLHTHLPA